MNRTGHVCLMAQYNDWMNTKLYEAAMGLPEAELMANRNAFFGSLFGTLNHLAVADTIWLKRFTTHPAKFPALGPVGDFPTPKSLDGHLFADIQGLATYRKTLDRVILDWAQALSDHDLDQVLHYSNIKGVAADKDFFSLVMHFFNHQTHHRGQATSLLSQAGVDVGVTDLLALIPNATAT
jgi:uncharacterized damage-inducible protein DinB